MWFVSAGSCDGGGGREVAWSFPNLPKPTFSWVLIINPNIDFIGTLQKSRFWRVKVSALLSLLRSSLLLPLLL